MCAPRHRYALDDFQVDIVAQFLPPPPPPPRSNAHAPPPPGVVALLGFEGTDDGVTSQRAANNGLFNTPSSLRKLVGQCVGRSSGSVFLERTLGPSASFEKKAFSENTKVFRRG